MHLFVRPQRTGSVWRISARLNGYNHKKDLLFADCFGFCPKSCAGFVLQVSDF